jgi:hypothetical protein
LLGRLASATLRRLASLPMPRQDPRRIRAGGFYLCGLSASIRRSEVLEPGTVLRAARNEPCGDGAPTGTPAQPDLPPRAADLPYAPLCGRRVQYTLRFGWPSWIRIEPCAKRGRRQKGFADEDLLPPLRQRTEDAPRPRRKDPYRKYRGLAGRSPRPARAPRASSKRGPPGNWARRDFVQSKAFTSA